MRWMTWRAVCARPSGTAEWDQAGESLKITLPIAEDEDSYY
jgi:hypothetical protein